MREPTGDLNTFLLLLLFAAHFDISNSEISDSVLKDDQRDGEQNIFALFFCYSPNLVCVPLRL